MSRITLRCFVSVPAGTALAPQATVSVTVEDTSRADAPAVAILQVSTPLKDVGRNGERLGPLDVSGEAAAGVGRYSVRAHISQSGPAHGVRVGDLISTRSHPLLPDRGTEMTIALEEVT